MIKLKHLLAKWTNKDPSTSLSCTKGINNEVLSFKMWKSNTVVTWNDTYASRSGKCRHSQNEPKLRSHKIFKIWHTPSLAKWTKIKISQYHWTIFIKHKSFGWYNLWKKNHLSFKCGTIIQWSLRMTHRLQDLNFGSFCEWRHLPDLEA